MTNDFVQVPRWVFKLLAGTLMMIMVSGAATTIIFVAWLIVLSVGISKQGVQLNAIRNEQRQVREELKKAPEKVAEEMKKEG